MIIFDTCGTLIYHGGCLEKKLWIKFSINGGLHLNISLYHEIGANINKLTSSWNTFSFLQQPYCNVAMIQKDYEGLDLMVVYPWNFAHVKKNHEKNIFKKKKSISFQVVKFIPNVLKTFVTTLWCYNDEIFDLVRL